MSVLDEIKALEEKKQALLAQAKKEALDNAKKAIAELNSLGFNYQLVGGEGTARAPGSRRTGIRSEVLSTIKNNPNGIARASILDALGVKGDKSGEQSVSNALAALKKAGTVTQSDSGDYVAS